MYNPFSLKNKKILVTGASSGIGRSVAIECSRMGAKMIISGRDTDRLHNTYNQLNGDGHFSVNADLTNESDLENLVETIPEIDGIVHSAGILKTLPFKFINRKDFDLIMGINFFAPVFLTKEIINKKKFCKQGSIVIISSLGAFLAARGNGMYSASKGAINSFSKVIALELSQRKIRVNCILPGMIKTELVDTLVISEEDIKADRQKYPLDYGEPTDVAYAAIYLLSDASKWITGNDFVIDGGVTLQ